MAQMQFNVGSPGWLESVSSVFLTATAGGGSLYVNRYNQPSTAVRVGMNRYYGPGGAVLFSVYQTFLSVDTSALPDDAIIDHVHMAVNSMFDSSATDFSVELRSFYWGAGGLGTEDFRSSVGGQLWYCTECASQSTVGWPGGSGYFWFNDTANFRAALNKTGTTYFVVSSSRNRVLSAEPTQAEYVILGASPGDLVLVVDYHVPVAPTVTTWTPWNIGSATATGGGNVTSDGGATVTARGTCIGASANPTTAGTHTTNGSGTGSFSSALTGLTPGNTYHVRAYATNSVGTVYGADMQFTALATPAAPSSDPTFTGTASRLKGRLTQVTAHSRALTAAEMLRIYQSGPEYAGGANITMLDAE